MNNNDSSVLMVVCFGVVAFGFFFFGIIIGYKIMKEEAIKNKVAEYRCDSETGKSTFYWKTNMVMESKEKTNE